MKSIVEYVNESANSGSIYNALKKSNLAVINGKYSKELFFELADATIKLDVWGLNGWKAEDKRLTVDKVKDIVDSYKSEPNAIYITEAEKLDQKIVNVLLSLLENKNVYIVLITTDVEALSQYGSLMERAQIVK